MPSDLWSFTLDFYARPGVEQACLSLQASGANVCLLLCGAWLTRRGIACDAERAREIGQLATPWHDEVVRPLRELRTQWRENAKQDAQLSLLREQVKALELEAERELLARLEARTLNWSAQQTPGQEDWLICLTGEAAGQSRDALQVLRAAMNQP
jgi:uncharacterized protein (TIGR02444 family)